MGTNGRDADRAGRGSGGRRPTSGSTCRTATGRRSAGTRRECTTRPGTVGGLAVGDLAVATPGDHLDGVGGHHPLLPGSDRSALHSLGDHGPFGEWQKPGDEQWREGRDTERGCGGEQDADGLGDRATGVLGEDLRLGQGRDLSTRTGSDRSRSGDGMLGGRRTARGIAAADAWGEMARGLGLDPIHAAIAFVRQRPFPAVPIIGATRLAQLDHLLSGLDLRLDDEALAALDSFHRAHPLPY